MTTDLQFGALLTVLGRIADALERQNAAAAEAAADDTLTFTISDYKTFDWSSIGATVVQRDADGVSLIRAANGKLAKRRSNDKFGTEIWFSYSTGKSADGTPQYQRVIEFREIAPPEPLGRKTEQALSKAPAATVATPAAPVAVVPPPAKVIPPPATTAAAPEKPTGPAVVPARDPAVDDAHAAAVKAYRARFNTDSIPGHLSLGYGDSENQVRQATDALARMATTGDQWGAHDVPADRTIPAPPPSANKAIEITPDEQARTEIASQVKRIGMRKATPGQHAEVTAALKAHGLEFAEFCQIVWQRPVADVSEGWVLGLHGWLRPSRDGQGQPFAANPAAREIVKAMAKAVPA
jgi:hypothetical protein